MFQVPTSVFDHCIRSCLTFKEQHESRRVAKAWTNISAVTKVIDFQTPFHKISPYANFRNVTSFHAYADSNVNCLQIANKILSQSRNSLKSIILSTDSLLFVPVSFPNVITLDFEGNNSTFAKLVSACPNLQNIHINLDSIEESLPRLFPHANVERIRLYTDGDGASNQAISYFLRSFPLAKSVEFSLWEDYTVDFADCPSAETFTFNESDIFYRYVNFENFEMSYLKYIEIELGDDPEVGIALDNFSHIAHWILCLPSVRFLFPIWLIDEEDDSCGWVVIVVHESKLWFKNWMCDIAIEKCAEKFAEAMKSILSIRDYDCHIEMKGQEAEKFKAVLTASHIFDEKKLEQLL